MQIRTSVSSEKGKTLIEILGVLSIIGMLSIGGLASYRYSLRKKLINDIVYVVDVTNMNILGEIENKTFSNVSEMDHFLDNYTQIVGKYKISFYAIEDSFEEKKFGTNVEMLDNSNIPPEICKDLILNMKNQYPIQSIDVRTGEKHKYIEAGTIDVNAICSK